MAREGRSPSNMLSHWRLYAATSMGALLLALVIGKSIPPVYSAEVKVSDEHKESDLLLGLNAFASMAKNALDDHEGLRQPTVYHRLVTTREFAEEMSNVRVEGYDTDYYHYMLTHHKTPWWERFSSDDTPEHDRVISLIRESIRSKVYALYGTIVLQVSDQDPVVAAMLVDSVRHHLQDHMAGYARDRAWRDLLTAQSEMEQAERRYTSARDEYVRFEDSHNDITSAKWASMEDHLMKEYETAFNDYSDKSLQYRRAKALVEKQSYTFAVLANATVPTEASSPFVPGYAMAFLFISLVVTTWWVLLKDRMREKRQNGVNGHHGVLGQDGLDETPGKL